MLYYDMCQPGPRRCPRLYREQGLCSGGDGIAGIRAGNGRDGPASRGSYQKRDKAAPDKNFRRVQLIIYGERCLWLLNSNKSKIILLSALTIILFAGIILSGG